MGGRLVGRTWAPNDQQLADMLHRSRIQPYAQRIEDLLAILSVVVENANLDQLVARQAGIDLFENRGREAVVADRHDRMQTVRERAQATKFGGTERAHAHDSLVKMLF